MAETTRLNDPQKILSELRDHLARHDKPIAFFFGAGTSCAVQVASADGGKGRPLIPAVAGLTEMCRESACGLGSQFSAAWASIVAQCETNECSANVESILSRVRMMIGAIGESDKLLGLNKVEIVALEECIRQTIAKVVTPDLDSLGDTIAHRKFARWLVRTSRQTPVEIFTLNYDVLFENALEAERIPVFDGFVGSFRPFFHADSLRRLEAAPGTNWTRLWKMHGSVTWRRVKQDGRFRVVRGEPDAGGEMIYPSFQKYDESRQQPYSAFADRLTRFLEQDDALLIACGFSFGDEHINNIIFGALENRPRTHVYALQFDDPKDDSDLATRAYLRPNMIVLGPSTAIVGGRRAGWLRVDPSPFLHGLCTFQQEVLSRQPPEESQSPDCLLRIGDFDVFSNFLQSMLGE
jgi:hypothetical protein